MTIVNHECYVSLEVAKLLKEADFKWGCRAAWDLTFPNEPYLNHAAVYTTDFNNDVDDILYAPTLEVAQRWLREVKGMCLTIQPLFDKVNGQFNVVVGFTPFIHRMNGEMIIVSLDNEHSYEKAQQAGIKKTLEIILEKGE